MLQPTPEQAEDWIWTDSPGCLVLRSMRRDHFQSGQGKQEQVQFQKVMSIFTYCHHHKEGVHFHVWNCLLAHLYYVHWFPWFERRLRGFGWAVGRLTPLHRGRTFFSGAHRIFSLVAPLHPTNTYSDSWLFQLHKRILRLHCWETKRKTMRWRQHASQ